MRALEVQSVGVAAVAERPVPVREPGWVLVDVLACGLCGTDRHILSGEYPSQMPLVLGHEFGGRVREVGEGSRWHVGDLVSVDPNIACGDCDQCRAGRVALCPERYALGVEIDGGLSEVVAVPETQLYDASGIEPVHLAFIEPLACCLRGMDLAGLQGGESVAVIGGGVMGQLVVQLAAAAGASRVTLITRQESRRALAETLGATDSAHPEVADSALTRTFDIVFECAGVLHAVAQAMRLARRGGSVILLGIPPEGATLPVSPFELVVDELRVQGSFLNPLTQERAVHVVRAGSLDLDALISRRIPLAEVPAVLAKSPGEGDIKYVVEPGSR
jgi:L-iditol 2-dehydrogenase